MPGFTDAVEAAMLDHFFTDPAYAPPATMYIGLSSTVPTEAGGNVTEPTTGAYARVATAAADWGPASGSAPAVKANTAAKAFATATADWLAGVNLVSFTLHSALTGGTVLAFGLLGGVGKPVLTGDTPSFPAGSLRLLMGDPSDVYA